MELFRIAEKDQAWLAGQPETGMGVQIIRQNDGFPDDLLFIIGGQVAFRFRDGFSDKPHVPLQLNTVPVWQDEAASNAEVGDEFKKWLAGLDTLPQSIRESSIISRAAFTLFPMRPVHLPPQPKNGTYGHLPFVGMTGAQDVYYRWEPWPVSRRINQTTGIVVPDTFTAPMSEIQFMPTGFSAVARLALPQLLPACHRWELRPPAKTLMRCGTSVPMFGQSGGGVEVAFPNSFTNVVPISSPTVLPAL